MIRRLRARHRWMILVTGLLTGLAVAWALLSPAPAEPPPTERPLGARESRVTRQDSLPAGAPSAPTDRSIAESLQ